MFMLNRFSLRALSVVAALAASSGHAQEVTLQSSDGTVNMTGDFIEYRNDAYTIETDFGPTRISAEGMTCIGVACPDLSGTGTTVAIGGSDTIGLGLMPLMLGAYANDMDAQLIIAATDDGKGGLARFLDPADNTLAMAEVSMRATNTGQGLQQLTDQQIDIAMASRRSAAENLQEHLFAMESLVIAVNQANPVATLSVADLRAIYSGDIKNWAQLGGEDRAITVIGRPAGSGTRDVFEDLLFESATAPAFPGLFMAKTNGEAARLVTDIEGAIAYVGHAFRQGTKPVTLIDDCDIPRPMDIFAVKSGDHPMQRRLYLYGSADGLSDGGQAFLDFATSPRAGAAITMAGFYGFDVARQAQGPDSARAKGLASGNDDPAVDAAIQAMLAEMRGFDRLSTTFRFDAGSDAPDERAVNDLAALISYLQAQPAGTTLHLASFTDDRLAFNGSLARSQALADRIAAELRGQFPGITLTSAGYGAIAPVACNATADGRRRNNRVEVWISTAG